MTSTEFISIGRNKISTQLLGEGEILIVLLHGAGVLSPILEFKALSNLLAEKYKVLVIENFGYGCSDCINKERTIQNIVCEIHEIVSKFHHKQYILMGHSMSGIYSLYYSNQYPNEVIAFIGIDSSVPKQIDVLNTQKINIFLLKMTRFLMKSGLLKLRANKPSSFLPSIEGVNWSDDESTLFKQLYLQNNSNDTILNELQNMTQNFKSAYNMRFADTIPALFFLSKQSCKQVKNWEQLHLDITNQHEQNKVVLYDGTHFLHYSHPFQIAQETFEWLASIGL